MNWAIKCQLENKVRLRTLKGNRESSAGLAIRQRRSHRDDTEPVTRARLSFLNLLNQPREHSARPALFELADALADQKANALCPEHGIRDLFYKQRFHGVARVGSRIQLRRDVCDDRNLRRTERHRRQKIG